MWRGGMIIEVKNASLTARPPHISGASAANVHLCQAAERPDLRLSLDELTCATLILRALRPGLAASLVTFSLSAAFGAYQIAANLPSS